MTSVMIVSTTRCAMHLLLLLTQCLPTLWRIGAKEDVCSTMTVQKKSVTMEPTGTFLNILLKHQKKVIS